MDLQQHDREIQRNREAWQSKPLLREIYGSFYRRIRSQIDPELDGTVVEIGSGIGNLKEHLPESVSTDLFPNPWLDVVCDGYALPFRDGALSHLVLFDVFHHLRTPAAFMVEAARVLQKGGRVILFEPYVSLASLPVYGLLHHEPLGWRQPIDDSASPRRPDSYYAAQGNATRLFFRGTPPSWLGGWHLLHREAFSDFAYLLSGGFSKPAVYPRVLHPALAGLDRVFSVVPKLFGARCLVVLEKRG